MGRNLVESTEAQWPWRAPDPQFARSPRHPPRPLADNLYGSRQHSDVLGLSTAGREGLELFRGGTLAGANALAVASAKTEAWGESYPIQFTLNSSLRLYTNPLLHHSSILPAVKAPGGLRE